MSNEISANSEEIIEFLRPKQVMEAIIDITANIQVLKLSMKALDSYKQDMLDEGTNSKASELRLQLSEEVHHLNNKLNALNAKILNKVN